MKGEPILATSETPTAACQHQFAFLRQEKRNIGYERNPRWLYEDVFFCEKCLTYQRVRVKETVPALDHFGEQQIG